MAKLLRCVSEPALRLACKRLGLVNLFDQLRVLFLDVEDLRFELLDALFCAAFLLCDYLDLPLELLCLANQLSVLAQQGSLLGLNMFHLELRFFHQVLL